MRRFPAIVDHLFAWHAGMRFAPQGGTYWVKTDTSHRTRHTEHFVLTLNVHPTEEEGMRKRRGTRSGRVDGSLAADLVKGAIAGAVGVWALDKVTWWMWNRENLQALQQEREARPEGFDPAHVMANRAAEAMGTELTPKQPHPAGIGVHYGLGIMPGAIYGVLRNRVDGIGAARGTLYGLGLFLLQDEGLNPLLGTSGKPTEYPWQAHARGLVGHLVLGLVTDAVFDALS